MPVRFDPRPLAAWFEPPPPAPGSPELAPPPPPPPYQPPPPPPAPASIGASGRAAGTATARTSLPEGARLAVGVGRIGQRRAAGTAGAPAPPPPPSPPVPLLTRLPGIAAVAAVRRDRAERPGATAATRHRSPIVEGGAALTQVGRAAAAATVVERRGPADTTAVAPTGATGVGGVTALAADVHLEGLSGQHLDRAGNPPAEPGGRDVALTARGADEVVPDATDVVGDGEAGPRPPPCTGPRPDPPPGRPTIPLPARSAAPRRARTEREDALLRECLQDNLHQSLRAERVGRR